MAIEYVLDLRCPVKEAVPTVDLMGLVRSQRQGELLLEMSRREGDQRPAGEITITRRVQTPEGVQEKSVSIQQMLDEAAPLEPLAHHCAGCRANMLEQPFGCYASISYPIRAAAEQWVMSRLPETLASTAGHFLVAAIRDFQYSGEPIARLRSKGAFFESRKPARRQWGPWLNKRTITSDQMLQMMFGLGNLGPSHCVMLALFLGILPHDFDPHSLSDTAERNQQLASARIEPPRNDPALAEMAAFLRTVAMSPVLDVPVLVDA